MEKILVYAMLKDKDGEEKARQLIGWINYEPSYEKNRYSLHVENYLMSWAIDEHRELNNLNGYIKEIDVK
jgi:hypothetical protein